VEDRNTAGAVPQSRQRLCLTTPLTLQVRVVLLVPLTATPGRGDHRGVSRDWRVVLVLLLVLVGCACSGVWLGDSLACSILRRGCSGLPRRRWWRSGWCRAGLLEFLDLSDYFWELLKRYLLSRRLLWRASSLLGRVGFSQLLLLFSPDWALALHRDLLPSDGRGEELGRCWGALGLGLPDPLGRWLTRSLPLPLGDRRGVTLLRLWTWFPPLRRLETLQCVLGCLPRSISLVVVSLCLGLPSSPNARFGGRDGGHRGVDMLLFRREEILLSRWHRYSS
jgi:hypothetical protein